MVTLQILVLPFLVRIRVSQQNKDQRCLSRTTLFLSLWQNGMVASCKQTYN